MFCCPLPACLSKTTEGRFAQVAIMLGIFFVSVCTAGILIVDLIPWAPTSPWSTDAGDMCAYSPKYCMGVSMAMGFSLTFTSLGILRWIYRLHVVVAFVIALFLNLAACAFCFAGVYAMPHNQVSFGFRVAVYLAWSETVVITVAEYLRRKANTESPRKFFRMRVFFLLLTSGAILVLTVGEGLSSLPFTTAGLLGSLLFWAIYWSLVVREQNPFPCDEPLEGHWYRVDPVAPVESLEQIVLTEKNEAEAEKVELEKKKKLRRVKKRRGGEARAARESVTAPRPSAFRNSIDSLSRTQTMTSTDSGSSRGMYRINEVEGADSDESNYMYRRNEIAEESPRDSEGEYGDDSEGVYQNTNEEESDYVEGGVYDSRGVQHYQNAQSYLEDIAEGAREEDLYESIDHGDEEEVEYYNPQPASESNSETETEREPRRPRRNPPAPPRSLYATATPRIQRNARGFRVAKRNEDTA